jgi:hypothetical protein
VRRWISVGEKAEVDMNLHAGVARQHEDTVDPAEAQQMVASRRRQVSACYERSLKRDPTLAGTITLLLRVGPAGQVLSSRVTDDTLKSRDVTECLRRETGGWLFRTMRNASVAYPFVFRAP